MSAYFLGDCPKLQREDSLTVSEGTEILQDIYVIEQLTVSPRHDTNTHT